MPKLSGLALILSVLHEILGGEFFRLHIVSEKCSVIGAQKGRNESKGVLVKPSAPLNRLCTVSGCVLAGIGLRQWLQCRCSSVLLTSTWSSVQEPWQRPLQPRPGYLFVETTACGFTLGAHISFVERFVTFAAAFCFVFMKVVAAATQCSFLGSFVCGVACISGLSVCHFVLDPGVCLLRVSRRRSLEPCASGDVLGLRLLGSCDITLGVTTLCP